MFLNSLQIHGVLINLLSCLLGYINSFLIILTVLLLRWGFQPSLSHLDISIPVCYIQIAAQI